MVYNRQKSVPCNPKSADSVLLFFENQAVKDMIPTEQNDMVLHQFVTTEQHAFAIFASPKILDSQPELRWFHVTSSMRVHADEFFKVFVTIAIIKDAEVRKIPKTQYRIG